MTWARAHAPESQRAITDAYTSIGNELGATVVPVGAAWQRFLSEHDQPVLHDRDQSHPALAGSYLAACVFVGKLFDKRPEVIAAGLVGVSDKDQILLQKVAWEICRAKL
jgi:hypothetical protein